MGIRRVMVVALILIPLIVCPMFIGAPLSNDFICSGGEKRAMSEFSHYGGTEPVWESNPKVTGGCAATFHASGTPEEVRTYYRVRLAQRGWAVEIGPDNSFPVHLEAHRNGLRYGLYFSSVAAEEANKVGNTDSWETLSNSGPTSVSLHGGHDSR